MDELVRSFRDFQGVLGEHAGFVTGDCVQNLLALLRQNVDEAVGRIVAEFGKVHVLDCGSEVRAFNACLAHNAAEAHMGVLHIRTGVAFEAHHGIPIETHVLQAAVLEVVEGECRNTDLAGDEFLVFKIRILLVDEFENLFLGGFNHVAKQTCSTRAGLALFPLAVHQLQNHAERNVVHVLVPFASHLLQNVEHLLEVERLSEVHHVETLVEVVFLLAVAGGGEVASGVQRGAVALADKAGVQVEFVQHHHVQILALHHQVLFAEFVENGRNLVFEEGFSGIVVKAHAHHVVDAHEFLERCRTEGGPELAVEFVALFQLGKCGARFVFETWLFLGCLGEGGVKDVEFLHGEAVERGVVCRAIFAQVHHDELTESGTPVAQVVDAFHLVACGLVDAGKGVSDHRRTQVVEGQFLTDVRGAEVDAHDLAIRGGVTIFQTLRSDFFKSRLREESAVDEEVQVTIHGFYLREACGEFHLCGQVFGDHLRGLAHHLRKRKAGDGKVAVAGVRRHGYKLECGFLLEGAGSGQGFCDFLLKRVHCRRPSCRWSLQSHFRRVPR